MVRMVKDGMTGDEAVAVLKHTGRLTLLSRIIKYNENGKKVSDTIYDYVNGKTYPTGGKKNTKTR